MLYRGDDARRMAKLAEIAREAFVPLIAVNDVLYHAPERRELQDIVTCIREHVTIDSAGRLLEANAERHLKSPEEMTRLFRKYPDAVAQTTALPRSSADSHSKSCAAPNIRKKPARDLPRRRRRWSLTPKRARERRFPQRNAGKNPPCLE